MLTKIAQRTCTRPLVQVFCTELNAAAGESCMRTVRFY